MKSLQVKFILIGFAISLIFSIINISFFDKYEVSTDLKEQHAMIKGDNAAYWYEAALIDKGMKNKNFFEAGPKFYNAYLPSKINLLFSKMFNFDLTNDNFKKITPDNITEFNWITLNKKKNFLLLFQSCLFYFSIYLLSKNIGNFLSKEKSLFVILFLSIEPTLLQWHSSFWTESIFLSLQIILLYLVFEKKLTITKTILIGLCLGFMYLQRSASIFFPIIIFTYIFFDKKKDFTKIFITSSSALVLVISFLGYHNFKRSGDFYVIPSQQKEAFKIYLNDHILAGSKNISVKEASIENNYNYNQWLVKNNITLSSNLLPSNEKEEREYYKFIQNYSLNLFKENPLVLLQFIIKKSLHTGVLDPVHVYFFHKYEYKSKNPYHLSKDHQNWILPRILYTICIYFFCLIGLIYLLKNYKKNIFFTGLILISSLYFFFILSWMGNPRYFVPSLIYLSFFFGIGFHETLNYLKKIK